MLVFLCKFLLILDFLIDRNVANGKKDTTNPVENTCLLCICQAITSCNPLEKCEPDDKRYGPCYITEEYWKDAGGKGEDFKICVNNFDCTNKTIQRYIEINSVDCNNNGRLECGDYFLIHSYGKDDCYHSYIEETPSWLRFLECYLNQVSNPRDVLENLIFNRNV
ncbi:invertebrate-type lysozyme-like [Centruroides vittatus]|uniref:invertebrate-type lysozyme-like n=1 Tax=Centruroides vittatus TaxID=120091 RepID=UPI003510B415